MNSETEQIFIFNPPVSQPSTVQEKLDEVPPPSRVDLENVADFSTVCRTCATITQFVIPIFAGEGLQSNLADKINKHLPIQVTEQDELPLAVCYQCAHTLLAWHELVACCEQADAALSLRLQQLKQSASQNLKSTSEGAIVPDKEQQKQFEEIVEFVEPLNSPTYESEPVDKNCEYCGVRLVGAAYKEHLIASHSDLLFHCDNCDTYVAKRDFILHMSVHAGQYSDDGNDEPKDTQNEEPETAHNTEESNNDNETCNVVENDAPEDNSQDGEIVISVTVGDTILVSENNKVSEDVETTNNNADNDFSDHSDTEYGFGPLPESVFEAIEDSQESQTIGNEPIIADIMQDKQINAANVEKPTLNKVLKHKRSRTCPICGKIYNASSSYFYHMKYTHNHIKDHECLVCGRKFSSKSCLTQHMVTHSDKCEYECKHCGKKFKSNASLYIHEQSHIGVKIFSCTQCQISFRWRTHLMRHMKRHSAEKSHACTTCGRGFAIHCDLLRHMRTHTAGDYKCEKCGVKFAQLRYLKVHRDKKHSTNEKEIKS